MAFSMQIYYGFLLSIYQELEKLEAGNLNACNIMVLGRQNLLILSSKFTFTDRKRLKSEWLEL